MTSTTLNLNKALPDKKLILEQLQNKFPNSESKLSFNNFIDIKYKDVSTSLDLGKENIVIKTSFDSLSVKNILLQVLAGVLSGIAIISLFEIEVGTWMFMLSLLGPAWLARFLLTQIASKYGIEFHQQVVAFLEEVI